MPYFASVCIALFVFRSFAASVLFCALCVWRVCLFVKFERSGACSSTDEFTSSSLVFMAGLHGSL